MFGGRPDAAFAAFVTEAQQRLYRQAYLLSGEQQAAQDLVQSTLVKLFLGWRRVESPYAYAQRTMVRTFLDDRRRLRRQHDLHRLVDGVASYEPDPGTRLTVLGALATLPPRMRAVVVLRYWEDLSVEQAAAALGCSAGTVKSSSSKALNRLRELLGETFAERVTTTTTGDQES